MERLRKAIVKMTGELKSSLSFFIVFCVVILFSCILLYFNLTTKARGSQHLPIFALPALSRGFLYMKR